MGRVSVDSNNKISARNPEGVYRFTDGISSFTLLVKHPPEEPFCYLIEADNRSHFLRSANGVTKGMQREEALSRRGLPVSDRDIFQIAEGGLTRNKFLIFSRGKLVKVLSPDSGPCFRFTKVQNL